MKNTCTNNINCHTEAKTDYCLAMPESDCEIAKHLEKAINADTATGLTITKLALLGNDHAITFTNWLKNDLCPETNIINYDIYKSMKNEDDDLRILHDSRYLDIFQMVDPSIIDFKVYAEKPFSQTTIVRQKKTIFADEMDRVLNPVLSDKVISFICGKSTMDNLFSLHIMFCISI